MTLASLTEWIVNNRFILNAEKTLCILRGTRRRLAALPMKYLHLQVNGVSIKQVESAKLLGVVTDSTLSWEKNMWM